MTVRWPQLCPHCGAMIPEAHAERSSARKSGNVILCPTCLWALVITDAFQLHALTQADIAALPQDVVVAIAHVQAHAAAQREDELYEDEPQPTSQVGHA